MVFSSFVFLFWFLPLFLAAYYAVPARWRNVALIAGSVVFYGWWRPAFVLLILVSVLVDYLCSLRMGSVGSRRRRTPWLVLAVCANLGLLFWFKYVDLLLETVNAVVAGFGGGEPLPLLDVVLPVGISFYTFQSMSYTIDVYRGVVKPVRSFVELLCFVSMFPQLVAGPIVRYRQIRDQLRGRGYTWRGFCDGVFLLMLGTAKKVLLADNVAALADDAFAAGSPGLLAAWCGVAAFSLQVYFDFSGYSDIAVGLGRMLGFELPRNFDSPYKATSFTEIWRRWHISLTSWMRDYVYRSLGGQKRGRRRGHVNVLLTMLLVGLWHGASWTFVLWGGIHGVFLVLERASGRGSMYAGLPRPLRHLATGLLWMATTALFRAPDLGAAGRYLAGLGGLQGAGALPVPRLDPAHAYAALLAGAVICLAAPNSWQLVRRFHPLVMAGVAAAFTVAVAQLLTDSYRPFVYFQF